ncbi:MAG: UDP-glucose 4-epimerase GalE [Phycisphaerales bacterium]|nr:UDP-glucose 4-epimerase GalE [Phycisphaerales bacterium]
MRLLVTGGAGYIGSHAVLRLLEDGHEVTVVDSLVRGHQGALDTLARIGGGRFRAEIADLSDTERLESILRSRGVEAVLHFAALAYVGESVEQPLRYHSVNACGSLSLLRAMTAAGVGRLVFSSTCATYGEPAADRVPIREDCPQQPINPYGRSKLYVEQVLRDRVDAAQRSGEPFGFVALRYFNVAGADREARIGEDHRPETHLVPICLEVAQGKRPRMSILGTDYPTPDGTCVRDYVHVEDLIEAHVLALGALAMGEGRAWNVGIGRGHSVREVLESCRRVTGRKIEAVEAPRRPGDPPTLYADAGRIRSDLGWKPRFDTLDAIVESAWRWHDSHPDGYGSAS